MKMENYNSSIVVNQSAQKTVESICNVSGWWATNVSGRSHKEGDIFTVRFGKTYSTIQIVELIKEQKICWLVLDAYVPLFKNACQWNNTEIVWEIFSNDSSSILTMTHVGLTPATECYIDCCKGWNFYVKESLYRLITTGLGLPGSGIFAYVLKENKRFEGLLYSKDDALPTINNDYILLDVKYTEGEHVTSIFSVQYLSTEKFNAENLKGEYYMLIENKVLDDSRQTLSDFKKLFNN